MSLRVIKLGGSLLTLPDWHERFLRWLATEPPATNLLLIGGGELVDCLRREHERYPYNERQMHFAALAAMDINAQLAHARLPQALLMNPNTCPQTLPDPPSVVIVKVTEWWYSSTKDGELVLEESWRITSDSLAAWLAVQQVGELVLLKSADPPLCENVDEKAIVWATQGYVDEAFPEWLCGETCRAVNLRASKWDVW